MPDLKSQLEQVKHKLSNMAFDDEGEAVQQQPEARGRSVSRTLWLHVRDNPGATSVSANEATGIETSSTSSLLSQMYTKGVLTRTRPSDGGPYQYTVVDPNYVPLSKAEALARAITAKAKGKPKAKTKAKAPVEATLPLPPNVRFSASIPELLDTMSVVQAREMYDALKKIFGG